MNFLVIRTCTHCVLSINGVLTNYLQLLKMSYAYNLVNSIFKDHRNGRNSQKNNDIRISWQYAHLVIIPTKFHKIPVQRFERSCTYKNTRLADWLFDWLTDWRTDRKTLHPSHLRCVSYTYEKRKRITVTLIWGFEILRMLTL